MKSNQLKIGITLSYISMGLNMLLQLVYTPIMIRLLGQSEYGLYTLVGSVVSYLSLFSLGFSGAYLRFYVRYNVKNDKVGIAKLNGMFLSLFMLISSIALICGMVLSQFTAQLFGTNLTPEELGRAKVLMQILVVNVALTFPSSIFDSIVGAHEQFFFQRMLQLVGILFNPLVCLPLLLMGYGSVAMVATTTGITITKLCVNVLYCICKLRIPVSFRKFDWSLMGEVAGFSSFLFLNMIIDQINWSTDKFIIGRVAGTSEVAIYGVGAQVNSVFVTLTSSISSVFAPQVNKIVAAHGKEYNEKLSALLVKVGRIQYMIVLYVFIGFVFMGRTFIRWWAGNIYVKAYYVAILLISPLIIILPHSLGIEIRRAKNRHQKASLIMLVTTVGNLIVSIPLAMRFGSIGAAAGTWLTLIINQFYLDIYYIRDIHLNIKLLYKSLANLTKALLIPIVFGLYGMRNNSFLVSIAWAVIYSVIFFSFLYIRGLNNQEKSLVISVVKKLKIYLERRGKV